MTSSFAQISDDRLVAEVKSLAGAERRATARLIACLAELDARRLYLGEGCSSLFTYCTQVLHLSEHAAYNRIEAARAARDFPEILERLDAGDITLTAVSLLKPALTRDNAAELLSAARHKSKSEVELLVAFLRPQPPVATIVRKLPGPAASVSLPQPSEAQGSFRCVTGGDDAFARAKPIVAPTSTQRTVVPTSTWRAVVAPLTTEQYRIQCTVSRETHDKLRRAQALLRHAVPDGDPAEILDRALTLLLAHLEKTKCAETSRPRSGRPVAAGSRHVPAAVRRAVWARDSGRCAFVGSEERCSETGFLEFHHVAPFAAGGPTTTKNIELRCRAHNSYEAEQFFGRRWDPSAIDEHVT